MTADRVTGSRRFITPLVALAVMLAIVAAVTLNLAGQARDDARSRVEKDADGLVAAIDQRILAYTEVLIGARGLFEARGHVTRREFRQFVRSQAIRARFPGIVVMSVAETVQSFDRKRFVREAEADAARSGSPYPPLRPDPAGNRPQALIIDYLEPIEGNEPVYGLDLLADPVRSAAVKRTQETSKPAATAPLRLRQDPTHGKGFLLVLAVRNVAESLTDPATGRLKGVMSAALRVRTLLDGVHASTGGNFDLEVYDVGDDRAKRRARPSRANLAYDRDGRLQAIAGGRDSGVVRRTLNVGGRIWELFYSSRGGAGKADIAAPLAAAASGLVLSLLAAWLMLSLTTSRSRAVELAGRMTDDLAKANAELERSNSELERFAGATAHDLHAPLRTISGFLDLLERRHADELTPQAREFVGYAIEGSRQLTVLIDGILAYARAGSGPRPDIAVELNSVWDRAASNLSVELQETGATASRGELPVVRGDPEELVRAFQNLISNAIVYRSQAPPSVAASARRAGEMWELLIADNGIGVAQADHEKIFDPLQRLHGQGERPGSGLGLAIAQRVVEATGGRIWIESELGAGATFHLTLPAA